MKRAILFLPIFLLSTTPLLSFASDIRSQGKLSFFSSSRDVQIHSLSKFADDYNRVKTKAGLYKLFKSVDNKDVRATVLRGLKKVTKKDFKKRPKVEFKSNLLWITPRGQSPIKIGAGTSSDLNEFTVNGKTFIFNPAAGVDANFTRAFEINTNSSLINFYLIHEAHGAWPVWLGRLLFYGALGTGLSAIAICIPAVTDHITEGIYALNKASGGSGRPSPGPKFMKVSDNPLAVRKLRRFIKENMGGCANAAIEGTDLVLDFEGASDNYCRNIARSVKEMAEARSGMPDIYDADGVTVSRKFSSYLANNANIFDSVTHPRDHFQGIDVYVSTEDANGGGDQVVNFARTLYWETPEGASPEAQNDWATTQTIPDDIKQAIVSNVWANFNVRNDCILTGLHNIALEDREGGSPGPGPARSQEN